METDIINIGTFLEHLTYYIKMGIYINKGTDNNQLLDRCINIYNKLKEFNHQVILM